MDLFTFKQEHPNAHGNLCYNCRCICDDEDCARASKKKYCKNFDYDDPKGVKGSANIGALVKDLERSYYEHLGQAHDYFNRLAGYIGK